MIWISRFLRLGFACSLFATLAAGLRAQAADAPAAAPAPAAVAPAAAPADDEIIDSFKLSDGDVDSVLNALEIYTGKTMLRPQALPTGTYTLSLKHVPRSELVRALETLLALNQIGIVDMDSRFFKAVPMSDAKAEAPEYIDGSTLDLPPSGRIVLKVFQPKFMRVSEFFGPQINNILSQTVGGSVFLLEKANAAIVTDTLYNVQRIELLLDMLDKPVTSGLTPKFYPLHFAKASDLVGKLHAILSGEIQRQIGTATTYNADDRTNQVIVMADPRELPMFDALISRLDVKSDPNTRNEVIYLKHADAKDVATLLSEIVSGQTAAASKSQSVHTADLTAPAGDNNNPAAPAEARSGGGDRPDSAEFSSLVTIQPDERSNSVVVSGTVDDIRLIHQLVDKIDILLAQVSIQVVIAEVTLTDTDQSGISALDLTYAGHHFTNFDTGTGPNGIAGWNITGGVVNPLAFQAAMGSTGSKNLVKVLSANTIVTTHNKQASFVVSEQEPIITGTQESTATTGGTPVTSSSVTYKDIGITVTVTPLIGDDGSIQLNIDQKVDDIDGEVTVDTNQQPIIGHREATSFVNVRDGEMIVLGGLQKTEHTKTATKFGFFYTIPILSNILGAKSNELDRTELLLFVRPHILNPLNDTANTRREINVLSNRDQVNQFLKDPSKVLPASIYDKYFKQ